MEEPILVDALPYIDTEYDEPGLKEMVVALIEDEKKRYRPTKNYLEKLPPLNLSQFETDVMKKEFERLSQRIPMEVLSMKRYELPPPPMGKLTDLAAWSECVDNSCSQLQHQAVRITNLDLMTEYGSEAWKSYLEVMVKMVGQAQKQLQELKREVQEVNWERKQAQLSAGEALGNLESSWVGLVSKNYEIQIAISDIEGRIEQLSREVETRRLLSSTSQPDDPNIIGPIRPTQTNFTNDDQEQQMESMEAEPVETSPPHHHSDD